jgi:hypothetical protein
MRSIFKSCYKFLPLCLGVVCIFLLVVALVPGQLEYVIYTIQLLRGFSEVLNLLLVGITLTGILMLILLTIYDLRKIGTNRRNNLKFRPTPALTSLAILACTWLLIQIHLPARLWFYTSIDRFEQALVQQQTLEDGNCQGTKKIGNVKILTTVVDGEDDSPKNAIYFYTMSDGICRGMRLFQDPNSYGFAYLPNDRGTHLIDTTHIYGKWYIFHENTSTGG